MKLLVFAVFLFLPISAYSQPNLFLKNSSGKISFDELRYPFEMRAGIAVLNNKCESCHSLARVVEAVETGKTSTGLPFDRAGLKQFVVRKKRRPDVDLGAQEAAELLRVMQYVLGDARKE